jgi:hypothetical protein
VESSNASGVRDGQGGAGSSGEAGARNVPLLLMAGVAGGMLLACSSRRRGAVRQMLGISGAALLAAALVAGERARFRAARTTMAGINVPHDRVFEFWSHYEDEPRVRHGAVGAN